MIHITREYPRRLFLTIVLLWLFVSPVAVEAANLLTSPATGVYPLSGNFTVKVVVNTKGQSINAAEGTITFNPRELSVVRVDRTSSVFNLWVAEPTFSNSAGTISFSGGSPTGYSGTAGTVFTITFRTLTAGETRVSYTSGSVLANDGRGTNVLSGMSGGTYTIEAATSQPAPEVIIEYVAPANTPAAPKVNSDTHPDQTGWYTAKEARLSWSLPAGVTAVRTLLDTNPNSIPSKVYDTPISDIVLSDLGEGETYFHIQFKNADGWGRVAHYRLAVDTIDPVGFMAEIASTSDSTNPEQVVKVSYAAEEKGSPVSTYRISIDGADPLVIRDEAGTALLTLPPLTPGYHTLVIEAVDAAGNTSIDTLAVTIAAFEPPTFTNYPTEISSDVIPVFKGTTRPRSVVEVSIGLVGTEPKTSSVIADEAGSFVFIPDEPFVDGVYRLSAVAKDEYGARSEVSAMITFVVQKPGYIRIGTWLVSALSVIVPLLALVMLLLLSLFWFRTRMTLWRGRVSKESHEVIAILEREFTTLNEILAKEKESLILAKRTKKLSEQEEHFFASLEAGLTGMRTRVAKEVQDVEKLVAKRDK